MKLKSLLFGTSLSLIPTLTNAQCVATTDCATLGYTETSCPDGKGIRCPFGTTYACCSDNCIKSGFKYTCTGEGYAGGVGQSCNNQYTSCQCKSGYKWNGSSCKKESCSSSYKYTCSGIEYSKGSGTACGGKYISCICTSGYEWKNGKCEEQPGITLGVCTGRVKNCKIADILNSDGSCTTNKENGKTPIGIVISIKDNCGYAMTASPIAKGIAWSTEDFLHGNYFATWQAAITDFNGCVNTQKMIQRANANVYPAAWATVNYAPSAAPATKGKWCLPAAGMLNSLYNNLDNINDTILKLDGQKLENNKETIWSSTEFNDSVAWTFHMYKDGGLEYYSKDLTTYYTISGGVVVRPIIAF